jgi:hypothetical protein
MRAMSKTNLSAIYSTPGSGGPQGRSTADPEPSGCAVRKAPASGGAARLINSGWGPSPHQVLHSRLRLR